MATEIWHETYQPLWCIYAINSAAASESANMKENILALSMNEVSISQVAALFGCPLIKAEEIIMAEMFKTWPQQPWPLKYKYQSCPQIQSWHTHTHTPI